MVCQKAPSLSISQHHQTSLTRLDQGERLLTFMVYLSTVRAGGATVFPALGLVVPPQEGTALFWHTINTQVCSLSTVDNCNV